MIETWKRTELEKLMRAYNFRYSKAWGQNFLVDKNVLEKVVSGAGLSPDDHVVEIGPGAGALTVLLAQAAGHVTAVEIDGRLIPILKKVTEGLPNVTIIHDDFLRHGDGSSVLRHGDGSSVLRQKNRPRVLTEQGDSAAYKLVGNLPYNITTPIIAGLFEKGADGVRPEPPELAVFMVQKEVAERLMSPPGKKAYGAISVLVQYYAEIEMLSMVSREVFTPRPNVDSAIIRLRPRDLSGDDEECAARMFKLVRAGFDMRRKTLRNSLAATGFSPEALAEALEKAGIDPVRRAETLSPRDFYMLAACIL